MSAFFLSGTSFFMPKMHTLSNVQNVDWKDFIFLLQKYRHVDYLGSWSRKLTMNINPRNKQCLIKKYPGNRRRIAILYPPMFVRFVCNPTNPFDWRRTADVVSSYQVPCWQLFIYPNTSVVIEVQFGGLCLLKTNKPIQRTTAMCLLMRFSVVRWNARFVNKFSF